MFFIWKIFKFHQFI